jgi:NHLM bacteriocin system ABC transporter ATP-binding protein
MARVRDLFRGLESDGDDNHASEPDELFLLKARYKLGRLVRRGSRDPILLDDRQVVWVVYAGRVDVFAVPVDDGEVVGVRRHLFRAEAGQAVFGMDLEHSGRGVALLAVGGPETELIRVKRSRLEGLAQNRESREEVAFLIDGWVEGLSSGIARDFPPQESELLEPTGEVSLGEHRTAHSKTGVLWVEQVAGHSRFMGLPGLPLMTDGSLPLSDRTWLQSVGDSRLSAVETGTLIERDPSWSGLDRFHRLVLSCVALQMTQIERAENERLRGKAEADRQVLEHAFSHLTAVLEPEVGGRLDEASGADPLLAACRRVGQAMDVVIQAPPGVQKSRDGQDALRRIARASRIRLRRVALRGRWWRADNGPMLAYREEGRRPVALLPTAPRRYELIDPVAHTCTPVTAEVAVSLAPLAYVFYRPFPMRALGAPDLLKFGLRGSRNDVLTVVLVGVAIGVLGMITPLAIGVLFDQVIPGAARSQLLQLGLALLVSAIVSAMFRLTQNVAVLRLEGKVDISLQTGVWDRLLRLPASFFRDYSAGDLAERAMGIDIIRRTLPEATISSILASVFSAFNFVLLFYFDAGLAWVAVGLVLLLVAVIVIAGHFQVRHQRALTALQGRISGMVLQFISGVAKLRVAGAEDRAFALWAKAFSAQKRIAFKAQSVANGLSVFQSAYPILTSIAVFAMVAFASEGQHLSTGSFLAFSAAFTQFLTASLTVSSVLVSVLNVVPVYERVRPILQALPEVGPAKSDPGELTGEIEVSHVVFRYRENEPLVLKDISLHVEPGEFVALVGPSGCGKSTLIRLLLCFETPLLGAIYYDGQDLAGLDVEAVRRQLGVVLQNGHLISGDIFTNIVGSSPLTVDDAWEAARMVGLDEDIEEMPMGLHTVISEGGGTLSGGQRQRLLIARAIVNKPRILFFDEATSALDNRTQAFVSESLERLHVTRVVVAHRLSTIVNADRILVLDDGKIVQRGTYDELMKEGGLFAELAKRQLS